jgi:catechol 2,3-dioxygenase-like lactoylglutathione lyase family enzyme
MDQRLSLVTLGVADFARSLKFYEALGWKKSSASQGDVAFFQMNGMALALYPAHLLTEDAKVPPKAPGFGGITLAINVRSKADVAPRLEEAKRAGSTILKPAQDAFWGGHTGYFADPDGYPWEVAWNPGFELTADGSLKLLG